MAKPSKTEHFTGPEARALVGKRVTFILNPLFLNILDVPAGAIGRIVSNHQHPHGGWCVQVVFSSPTVPQTHPGCLLSKTNFQAGDVEIIGE